MTESQAPPSKPASTRAGHLLQSGIILSAVTFLANASNTIFVAIIRRQMDKSEFGLANTVMSLVQFLSLPLGIATMAMTHYIARFKTSGDNARLQGLLAGCQKFLFRLTIAGSVAAVLLIKPLSDFFQIPRLTVSLAALFVVLTGLWGSLASALCQGMSWFKRLAFIALLGAVLRLIFGWLTTRAWPTAEWSILSSAVMVLANLILLFWKTELSHPGQPVSPWNRELFYFFIVSAACVGANNFFSQGDMLVALRNLDGDDRGIYATAEKLATALPLAVGPLLTVLFTHRSGAGRGSALQEQIRLLVLYAVGLLFGAVCLYVLRDLGIRILAGSPAPESAALIGRLAVTMIFVGLLQSLGMWSLASRWFGVSLLYGALGLAYWLAMLWTGKSLVLLLKVMPIASGAAFAILFVFWLAALIKTHSAAYVFEEE
jgi:O-antigen/teichoic acid export membrane protein